LCIISRHFFTKKKRDAKYTCKNSIFRYCFFAKNTSSFLTLTDIFLTTVILVTVRPFVQSNIPERAGRQYRKAPGKRLDSGMHCLVYDGIENHEK